MNYNVEKLKQLTEEEDIIKESQILICLPYEMHNDWDNFMRGKTCPVLEGGDHGVYSWDLKKFLQSI